LRNNKAAIKRAKQAEARRLRNSHIRSTMKTHIKRVGIALENKDMEQLNKVFKEAMSQINRAASKNVIHKKNAARKISRLSKKIHNFSQSKE